MLQKEMGLCLNFERKGGRREEEQRMRPASKVCLDRYPKLGLSLSHSPFRFLQGRKAFFPTSTGRRWPLGIGTKCYCTWLPASILEEIISALFYTRFSDLPGG